MIGPRSLYVVAILFSTAGFALHLVPASSWGHAVAPMPARAAPMEIPASPTGAGSYDAIITSNVFSSTRAVPPVRMVPEAFRRDTQTGPTRRAKPAEPPTRLYGITRGTEGAVALIDADPKIPGAEVYRVGDLVRGARITEISDSTVVLGRPSGPIVLRLPVAERERR